MKSRQVPVSDFYAGGCQTQRALRQIIREPNRFSALSDVLESVSMGLVQGDAKKKVLQNAEKMLTASYDASWFPFGWQKDIRIQDDLNCINRLLDWLCAIPGFKAVRIARPVEVTVGETTLSSRVWLIYYADHGYGAVVLRLKTADKSPGGRSVHTNSETDLYSMCAKAALEEDFPGIRVHLVYFYNELDADGSVGQFLVGNTRKSNVFTNTFQSFYEEGSFEKEAFYGRLQEVMAKPPGCDCDRCEKRDLCDAMKLGAQKADAVTETVVEQMKPPQKTAGRTWTPAQQKVIAFDKGQMVVFAGPGSGKTATLTERTRRLIASGIPPELILVITFTREAAGELVKRCSGFCPSDALPEILTLNALGYQILRQNDGLFGREVRLLTHTDRLKLIQTLLSAYPPMHGISYAKMEGRNGCLETLSRRLTDHAENPQRFYERNPGILQQEFEPFAVSFDAAIKAKNYIGFDEQVSLATELIHSCPKVLDGLRRRYPYLMVDEYQDINADQAAFIYALAGDAGNVVAVGDDDQSIYAFRGASHRYMLDFGHQYPNAEKVVLRENFRSTEALTGAAGEVIRKNRDRMDKGVVSVRKGGVAPIIRNGQDVKTLTGAVEALHGSGIPYREIAVLASKNATLENLAEECSFPVRLGKSFLPKQKGFLTVLDLLNIHYKKQPERSLVHLRLLLGTPLAELPMTLQPGHPASILLTESRKLFNEECEPSRFIHAVYTLLGMADSAEELALMERLEEERVGSIECLHEVLLEMLSFGDDTRVSDDVDSVLFITSHEAKGMEWQAVILVDDFNKDASEEVRRLYYVAVTRAKDRLVILTKDGRTLLTQENESPGQSKKAA